MIKSLIISIRVAFFLAVRAIIKGNKGITLLTIVMLILVTMNLLFVPGLIDGIVESSNSKLINTYSGDVIIEAAGDDPNIIHAKELISLIESIPGVTAATSRNTIGAEISFEDERTGVVIAGIDPEQEKRAGSYLEPRDSKQILLGVQIAGSDLQHLELYSDSLRYVHAGDKVVVKYSNGVERQYDVKGIFQAEFLQTDAQAFISQREFLSIVPTSRNSAMSIRVRLEENANPDWITQQISGMRDGLKFQTWQETAGIVSSMTDSFNIIRQILNVINILVAGITVFIVTYVDVVNRKRHIGIQRAIGITPQSITLSYIIRALFYALVGVIVGSLLFTYIVVPLEARYPFHFPMGNAYIIIDIFDITRVSAILLGVALVAAFIPVRRIMTTKILDAIWG
jgi:putative ABC transport system permease protein